MSRCLEPVVVFVTSVLVGLTACADGPAPGTERGPCYGNGTCNAGLTCFSNVCVFAPDAAVIDASELPIDAPVDGPDAADAPIDATPIAVADIDGTWLIGLNPSVAPGSYVQLAVDWNLTTTGIGGTLDGTYQPLRTYGIATDSLERVPVGAPIAVNAVQVTDVATFRVHLVGTLPGPANPINGTEYQMDMVLVGRIGSPALVCGSVEGNLGPLNVAGSTMGAARAGAPLPAPIVACP